MSFSTVFRLRSPAYHHNVVTRAILSDQGSASMETSKGVISVDFGMPFAKSFIAYSAVSLHLSGFESDLGEVICRHVQFDYLQVGAKKPVRTTLAELAEKPHFAQYDNTFDFDPRLCEDELAMYFDFRLRILPMMIKKPSRAIKLDTIRSKIGMAPSGRRVEAAVGLLCETTGMELHPHFTANAIVFD